MTVSVVNLLVIPPSLAAMHVTVYSPGERTVTLIILLSLTTIITPSSFTIVQEILASAGVAEQVKSDASPNSTMTGVGGTTIVGKSTVI